MSRIFIKGEKLPIQIEYEKAVPIKNFYDDRSISDFEKVSIGKDWSGTKGDIRNIFLDFEEYRSSKKPKKDPFNFPEVSGEERTRGLKKIFSYLENNFPNVAKKINKESL